MRFLLKYPLFGASFVRLTNQNAEKQVTSKQKATCNPYSWFCVLAKPTESHGRLPQFTKPIKTFPSSSFVVVSLCMHGLSFQGHTKIPLLLLFVLLARSWSNVTILIYKKKNDLSNGNLVSFAAVVWARHATLPPLPTAA